jgi:hypothetical protein
MTPRVLRRNVPGMIESTTIPVWVTSVEYRGGAVAYGRGETEDGDRVGFAGEPRALWAIAEALDAGDGPVLAAIPTWWSIIPHPFRARRPPCLPSQQTAVATGGPGT